ncbi:MAG: hypothetical protein OQJ76_01040, partial [Rhodospirillales bacterium]|nr:hypothetical protein [Rhodospirillales bacterium]
NFWRVCRPVWPGRGGRKMGGTTFVLFSTGNAGSPCNGHCCSDTCADKHIAPIYGRSFDSNGTLIVLHNFLITFVNDNNVINIWGVDFALRGIIQNGFRQPQYMCG